MVWKSWRTSGFGEYAWALDAAGRGVEELGGELGIHGLERSCGDSFLDQTPQVLDQGVLGVVEQLTRGWVLLNFGK